MRLLQQASALGAGLGSTGNPALDRTALEYVIDGDREYRELERQLMDAEAADNGTKLAVLHGKIEMVGGYSIRARASELLDGLGFTQEQMSWSLTQFLVAGGCV